MKEFDSSRIKEPRKFIDDMYRRLVGLQEDIEDYYSRVESLEYCSKNSVEVLNGIINWMISQQD